MQKAIRITSFMGCIILLGLTGCARYKAHSLDRLMTSPQTKKSAITFSYNVLTEDDCQYYLDRDVIAKGYQPIHITFTNNTNKDLVFSTANFSFPCVTSAEVAQEVHTNTAGRVIGYGAASFICFPLIIPAIVDGVGSAKANKKLNSDFARKALRNQIVKPMSTINGLIFASVNEFDPNFKFTVVDTQSNQQYTLNPCNPTVLI